jgi:methylase of polypeptide subunit release factors
LYEPLDALFPGDKKGIIFYKKLLPIMNKLCRKDGLVLFEISPLIVKDIMEILMINKVDAKVANDYNGYPRLVYWKNM